MRVIESVLNGLVVIEPRVFYDTRGTFYESFNKNAFFEITGSTVEFLQDNHSVSHKNVIRGLHLQAPPYEQGKLVRVASGKVYDVAVDIRKDSSTYGQYFGIELSAQNALMLWIPPGFAHGFSVLEENTVFLYKCTNLYNKDSERTLLYNDSKLNIDWKVKDPVISDKDKEGVPFDKFQTPF